MATPKWRSHLPSVHRGDLAGGARGLASTEGLVQLHLAADLALPVGEQLLGGEQLALGVEYHSAVIV